MASSNTFFLNGSTLLQLCTSQSLEEQAACEGYILGVQDSIFSGHLSGFYIPARQNSAYNGHVSNIVVGSTENDVCVENV